MPRFTSNFDTKENLIDDLPWISIEKAAIYDELEVLSTTFCMWLKRYRQWQAAKRQSDQKTKERLTAVEDRRRAGLIALKDAIVNEASDITRTRYTGPIRDTKGNLDQTVSGWQFLRKKMPTGLFVWKNGDLWHMTHVHTGWLLQVVDSLNEAKILAHMLDKYGWHDIMETPKSEDIQKIGQTVAEFRGLFL